MDPADPNLPPEACYLTCVPDGVCPPGTYEQTVCEGWDGQGEPPPEPICWTECVGEPTCPPGQHQEIECYPDSVDGPCQLVCVDDGEPVPPPQPM